MPFQNPPSPQNDRPRRGSGALHGLAQAESLMQIALILPCALVIGWGAGWWVDHRFHSHWATIPGLILGLVSGMVSVVRMALAAGNRKGGR
jgi:F0F1-type ATP synthase assembly protein I